MRFCHSIIILKSISLELKAVVLILESDNAPEVKEQALCILANIADGDSAKQFIMSNEDVLKKVTNYMMHSNVKLQTAAVLCVHNLAWAEDDGALERQAKLRDIGVVRILQQLKLSTTDSALFDKYGRHIRMQAFIKLYFNLLQSFRVKTALQQFP